MGKKNKLAKFAEIKEFDNVFEHTEAPKGKWSTAFKKPQPLVLELACGKGEYTLGVFDREKGYGNFSGKWY